jgi:hypothetical protein
LTTKGDAMRRESSGEDEEASFGGHLDDCGGGDAEPEGGVDPAGVTGCGADHADDGGGLFGERLELLAQLASAGADMVVAMRSRT